MTGPEDVDALLDLLAEVDARARDSALNGAAAPALAASLAAVPYAVPVAAPEPSRAPQHASEPSVDVPAPLPEPVERASLAENVIIQFLVHHAVPWSYQEQVLVTLSRVRPSRWQLVTILSVAVFLAVWLGYVPIPQAVTDRIGASYRAVACPSPPPVSAGPVPGPLPVPQLNPPTQHPQQEQAHGNPQVPKQ